jgi:predicted lipoprotein with Yx(FWY)xxD motif
MLRSFYPHYRTLIMNKLSLLASVFVSFLLASGVQAQTVVRDGILADASGRTVYTFDKDAQDKSNCAGGCLASWSPFVAKPAAVAQGELGLIDTNGVRQWTLRGKPLYYFVGDSKTGDRNGDGIGGVWHVVTLGNKPAAVDKPAVTSSSYL